LLGPIAGAASAAAPEANAGIPDAIWSPAGVSPLEQLGVRGHDRSYTIESHMVPMDDGVRLKTMVAIPEEGSGPWPIMLYRTPYNVETTNVNWIADAGYVGVSQDMRGRWGSEGLDRMFRDEGWGPDHRDGLDTVEWLLRQEWCNGRIATWGASASGISSNMLAAALPDSVRCMVTYVASCDLYPDLVFPGGAFKQVDVETWLRAQGSDHMIDSIYAHPNHDAWWSWLDTSSRHPQETIPIYQVGGWFDIFPEGTIRTFTGLQYRGGPGAAGNQKLVMGPWIHGADGGSQGEMHFPDAWLSTAMEITGSLTDWLNYWVIDVPTGIMDRPAMAYYLMGDVNDPLAPGNEWRTTDVWPLPAVPLSLYLREEGDLSFAPPGSAEEPRMYAYDPLHPVPTLGGGNLAIAAGPYDQRPVLERPDVLVYQSPVLAEPWEVAGPIEVELYISSDCLDTDFTAKLCDVYPNGRAMLLVDGIRRARHRLRMDGEDPLVPGEVARVTISLSETAVVFNRGHRILLAISSSNAPRFDPNPNTGEPFMRHTRTVVAHNAVHHDRHRPSRLLLPLTGQLPAAVGAGLAAHRPEAIRWTVGPSPSAGGTWVQLTLARPAKVEVGVYNTAGRLIRTLLDDSYGAGTHRAFWDGADARQRPAPAGVYRIVLRSAQQRSVRPLILVR